MVLPYHTGRGSKSLQLAPLYADMPLVVGVCCYFAQQTACRSFQQCSMIALLQLQLVLRKSNVLCWHAIAVLP